MPLPFEYWGPKQCAELFERMKKYGPENCRLELRHYGYASEDGHGNGHLRVVPLASVAKDDDPDINESIWCPPLCG